MGIRDGVFEIVDGVYIWYMSGKTYNYFLAYLILVKKFQKNTHISEKYSGNSEKSKIQKNTQKIRQNTGKT